MQRKTSLVTPAMLVLVLGMAQAVYATNQVSSVVGGAGGHGSSGVATNQGTCAQSGGVAVSSGGTIVNYAGFINTFSLRPLADLDGDGLEDEVDSDNDGDLLTDLDELSGDAFGGNATTDPNDSDTDDDGMNDAAEAAAMFDPRDPNHRLAITELTRTALGDLQIVWIGRGGGTINTIYADVDLQAGDWPSTVHEAASWEGAPPWYKTTNTHSLSETAATRFFRVTVPGR